MMKLYAIAYLYQEDVFFDFAAKEDVMGLESTCLLPTKELADEIISHELDSQYVPVEITIESVSETSWSWSRETIAQWDEVDFE